jgi:DNA replication protein DnaC
MRSLQLSYIASHIDELCQEAKDLHLSHRDFLLSVLDKEVEHRREGRLTKRIREARFPYRRYIQDIDLGEYATDVAKEIESLFDLDFIGSKENVIAIGNPGRGNYVHE